MTRFLVFLGLCLVAVLFTSLPVQAQICPPQGAFLTLTPSGPAVIGSQLVVNISGPLGQPYLLAMDTVPGPITVPGFGCIALGLSPGLIFVLNGFAFPFAVIPPSGTQTLNFQIPNTPTLVGQQFFFQAVVGSPSPPSLALSNGSMLSIGTSPLHAYIIDNCCGGHVRVLDFTNPGCPTQLPPIPMPGAATRLAANVAAGTLYVARDGAQDIAAININTNSPIPIPTPPPVPSSITSIALDPTNSFLFALSYTAAGQWEVRRIQVSPATWVVTHTFAPSPGITGAPPEWGWAGIVVEPSGQRVFFSRPGGITVLNASNLTFIGTLIAPPEIANCFRGLAFRPGAQELWAGGGTGVWIVTTAPAFPYFVDPAGNAATTATYPFGGVRDIAFGPVTNAAYCSTDFSTNLVIISPGSLTPTTYNVLYQPGGAFLGVSAGENYLIANYSQWPACSPPRLIQLGVSPAVVCDMGGACAGCGGAGLFGCFTSTGDVIFR